MGKWPNVISICNNKNFKLWMECATEMQQRVPSYNSCFDLQFLLRSVERIVHRVVELAKVPES